MGRKPYESDFEVEVFDQSASAPRPTALIRIQTTIFSRPPTLVTIGRLSANPSITSAASSPTEKPSAECHLRAPDRMTREHLWQARQALGKELDRIPVAERFPHLP
jgi:hypothetical protein